MQAVMSNGAMRRHPRRILGPSHVCRADVAAASTQLQVLEDMLGSLPDGAFVRCSMLWDVFERVWTWVFGLVGVAPSVRSAGRVLLWPRAGLVRTEFSATAVRLREAIAAMAAGAPAASAGAGAATPAAGGVHENAQAMEDVGEPKADPAAGAAAAPPPAAALRDAGAELRGAISGARIAIRNALEAVRAPAPVRVRVLR
jgi:hypothetical protein